MCSVELCSLVLTRTLQWLTAHTVPARTIPKLLHAQLRHSVVDIFEVKLLKALSVTMKFIYAIGIGAAAALRLREAPAGVDGIMSKLDAIVASSGNAPDAAAGSDAAQGELAIFQERVASEQKLNALSADAYVLAREAVAQLAHTGGCPRSYSYDCPAGWTKSGGVCNAPSSYNGPCQSISTGGDAAAKEKIAVQCEAGWPCENSAPLNFSGCPRGWTASAGGLCTAPSAYDGICGHTTNFSSFSKTESQVGCDVLRSVACRHWCVCWGVRAVD